MKLRITIHGTAYDVDVEVIDAGEGFPSGPLPKLSPMNSPYQTPAPAVHSAPKPLPTKTPASPASSAQGNVNSPIAGTILEIKCKPGDQIQVNQELLVIEAMKMETSIAAPISGVVVSVDVAVGDAVREGQTLVQLQ